MTKGKYLILATSYLLLILGLFFYSFTQTDLNLTLSQSQAIQNFQNFSTQIGYFNRPLSTFLFVFLVLLLTTYYLLLLWLVKKNRLSGKQIYLLLGLTVGVLLFSYPAFSHDIFNYMFWAKIFTHYGLSPYQYKALDFPLDPWVRFMHWTHTPYNHGPIFLLLSLVPSFLGVGIFSLTFLNFKILTSVSFLGSIFFLGKIMEKIDPKNKLLAISFFAFNPLVITESLVSGHDDIVMLFIALIAIYFLVSKKKIWAFIFLLLSVGVKFVTITLLPIFILVIFSRKINWNLIFTLMILGLLIGLISPIIQREPYPWYFVTVAGIASLLCQSKFIRFVSFGLTLGLLLRYAPFLYFGDYKQPVPTLTLWLTIIPLFLSLLSWVTVQLYYFKVLKKKA